MGIPYTRKNIIAFNWLGQPSDPWTPEDEMQLPEDLQDWSIFEEIDGEYVLKGDALAMTHERSHSKSSAQGARRKPQK